jgi:hypothetical protein
MSDTSAQKSGRLTCVGKTKVRVPVTEPSTVTDEGLVERLLAFGGVNEIMGQKLQWLNNPDGPEAAERIKELASGHTALLREIEVRLPKLVQDAYEEGVEDGMAPDREGTPGWIDSVARVEMLRAVAALSRPLVGGQ